jgi:F0F1-type ATP synthase assembly protein I
MGNIDVNIMILGILFIGLIGCLLFAIKRKNAGMPLPLWLPTLSSVIIICILILLTTGKPAFFIPAILIGLVLLTIAAVIQSFMFFSQKDFDMPDWTAVLYVCGPTMFLLVIFLMSGGIETLPGSSFPPFSVRFPLTGWAFDGFVSVANIGGTAYISPVYEILIFCGYYLEVVLGAMILFFILSFGGNAKISGK